MASDYDSWMVNTLCDELSVKKLKCSIDDLESLQKLLDKIINARDKSINILSEAIESLSKHHRNVKVARVTGRGISIGGKGLMFIGLAAAIPTAGISLIVTAVGAGISTAGEITHYGAEGVGFLISWSKERDVKKVLKEGDDLVGEFHKKWKSIASVCKLIEEKYSHPAEKVLEYLLCCCIKVLPVLQKKVLKHQCEKMMKILNFKVCDKVMQFSDGADTEAIGCRLITALVVQKTCSAMTHCRKLVAISGLVRKLSGLFNITAKVCPLFLVGAIAFDILSIITCVKEESEQIRMLTNKRKELSYELHVFIEMKNCLDDLLSYEDNFEEL